jgi:mono/diheme cytochrome c family protein
MKKLAKILGWILGVLIVVAAGAYAWASVRSSAIMAATVTVHTVDFSIPFPIEPDEVVRLGLTPEAAQQMARDQAVERGKHLVNSRYGCVQCHGKNFGGGVMVDAFPLGRFLAPNLTTGPGSRTLNYKASDWDHIVRHGVLPDGKPAIMPSVDFKAMSDEELADIVSYIRSFPPVDNTVPKSTLGPLGKFLVASGNMRPSAYEIAAHPVAHLVKPPEAAPTAEYGHHLAGICMGCHRADLSGGQIAGGDPSWPPARDLTPDPLALGPWTYDQFLTTVRTGRRPDGTTLQSPMIGLVPYFQQMTDVEVQAIWAYLRSVPPVPVTTQYK